MDEPTTVDFASGELPDAFGDSASSGGVVSGEQSERMVPQRDLDNLRSIEQSKYGKLEKQFNQLRDQLQRQEQEGKKQSRLNQLTQAWTQQYLAQGHDEATARYWATKHATDRVEQEFEQAGLKAENESLKQQQTRAQFQASLAGLRDRLMQTTGLSEEQLRQATKGLHPDTTDDFFNQVWERAITYAKNAGQQGQAQQARAIRNRTPFLAGGNAPAATYQELPHNVKLGSESGTRWLEEQKALRRRR